MRCTPGWRHHTWAYSYDWPAACVWVWLVTAWCHRKTRFLLFTFGCLLVVMSQRRRHAASIALMDLSDWDDRSVYVTSIHCSPDIIRMCLIFGLLVSRFNLVYIYCTLEGILLSSEQYLKHTLKFYSLIPKWIFFMFNYDTKSFAAIIDCELYMYCTKL